jgi:hypothetical protein
MELEIVQADTPSCTNERLIQRAASQRLAGRPDEDVDRACVPVQVRPQERHHVRPPPGTWAG